MEVLTWGWSSLNDQNSPHSRCAEVDASASLVKEVPSLREKGSAECPDINLLLCAFQRAIFQGDRTKGSLVKYALKQVRKILGGPALLSNGTRTQAK